MRFLIRLSIGLLLVDAAIHLATFPPGIRMENFLWVFLPMLFAMVAFFGALGVLVPIAHEVGRKNLSATMRRYLPRWVGPAFAVLFIYTGFNFVFSLFHLTGGLTPAAHDGAFTLENHGRFVRAITEAEYYRFKTYQVRGMITHAILFQTVALAIFWSVDRRRKELPGAGA